MSEAVSGRRIVMVTGTSTGVGKTVVTAALAAAALRAGRSVSIVKPVQTGATWAEPPDTVVASALSGCEATLELVRLDLPLAPDTAARERGVALPPVQSLAPLVGEFCRDHDLALVEGAGGVLVRLDTSGGTLMDLAIALRELGQDVSWIVVTTLQLGTLNHTALTVEALRARDFEPSGLVIGSVPDELALAERCNLDDLPYVTGVPLIGRLPAGIGRWDPRRFQDRSPTWVSLATVLP